MITARFTPYLILLGLTLGYAFIAPQGECLEYFDCNYYIAMVNDLSPTPEILPHHAMRILPPLLARGLMAAGCSLHMSFRILSAIAFVLFGCAFYYCLLSLLKEKLNNTVLLRYSVLAFTMITLCCDHNMIAALVYVYQANDALTYPLGMGIAYFTFRRQALPVFVLSVIGLFNRQCLFPFGFLALTYLSLTSPQQKKGWVYAFALLGLYQALMVYYHAHETLSRILTPEPGFFSIQHISQILVESELVTLFIPIVPFVLLCFPAIVRFFIRNWFLLLYCAITVGQPFLSYHFTGNNFNRIALQGVWPLYFVTAYVFIQHYASKLNATFVMILMIYALLLALAMGVGTTYGIWLRASLMIAMVVPLIKMQKVRAVH